MAPEATTNASSRRAATKPLIMPGLCVRDRVISATSVMWAGGGVVCATA